MPKFIKPTKTEYLESNYSWDIRLTSIIKQLEEALKKVPREFRDEATLTIETVKKYGTPLTNYRVSYERPMTKEEIEERRAVLKSHIAILEKNT